MSDTARHWLYSCEKDRTLASKKHSQVGKIIFEKFHNLVVNTNEEHKWCYESIVKGAITTPRKETVDQERPLRW